MTKGNNLLLSDSHSVNLYDLEKKERVSLLQAPEGIDIAKSEIDPHHPDLVYLSTYLLISNSIFKVASILGHNVVVTDVRDKQYVSSHVM